ncbi:MAG: cobalt ECF transporter T component CbiQ [Candidatus Competibacteraceae bacterium]|nr:cobalt ECF transporter T component CbiQ [Candidatus Competibacteraceae bacterium]
MRAIDRHAWTNRWRDWHPAEKLLPAFGLLLMALLLPPLTTAPLIVVVAGSALVWGAGVPARALLVFVAPPAAFLLLGAPFLALSLDLSAGPTLRFSPGGVALALSSTLRALAALSCLALVALTTPVADWASLLRRAGVPAGIIELLLLMYRLVFSFAERALTGQRAQAARLGYSRFGRGLRSFGLLAGNLFQRGLTKARALEIGLTARGYRGELPVLRAARPLCRSRLATAMLGVGLTGLAGGWLGRALS